MPHTFAWPCCVVVLFSMWAGASTAAEMRTVDAESVVKYVESCRKPNGAFGPKDQEYTDAAWERKWSKVRPFCSTDWAFPKGMEVMDIGCFFIGK